MIAKALGGAALLAPIISHGAHGEPVCGLVETHVLVGGDPEPGEHFFGWSIAIWGDLLAVGASEDRGAVHVFRFEGRDWTAPQRVVAVDSLPGDRLGWSVAAHGDRVIAGAVGVDDAGISSGAAYVFRLEGVQWIQEQKLAASDATPFDQFGSAVALGEGVAIVGAHGDDDLGENSGSAYVFRYDRGAGSWVQAQKLRASDGQAFDEFGAQVAMSEGVALVAAPDDDDRGPNAGAVYVFRFDPQTMQWTQEQKLVASDGDGQDEFGYAVAVSGDVAVVGAHADEGFGDWTGSAYVFREREGAWTQEQKLLPPDAAAGHAFGRAVAIDGKRIVVGAPGSTPFNSAGQAWVFEYDGTAWSERWRLLASDGASGDYLGNTVTMHGPITVLSSPHVEAAYAYVEPLLVIKDCNGNGVIDGCDILEGRSADCNRNDSPDECDVSGGSSRDRDGNGVPDECQDCNGNGVFDPIDLADGTSLDCNGNGIPDECDLTDGTSRDCQGSGIPDECEISDDPARDGDFSGILDVCERCGDLDGSGAVDGSDLWMIFGSWGTCPPQGACTADLDDDGVVGITDFLELLGGRWGRCF